MERLYLLMTGGAPILGALVGTLALTLLVGRLTRRRFRPLRLLPLGLLAIPLTVAAEQYLTPPWAIVLLGAGRAVLSRRGRGHPSGLADRVEVLPEEGSVMKTWRCSC